MEFFEAAANWADKSASVVSFERDQFDGWYAKIEFRDVRGPYSAMVNAIARRAGKNEPETIDEFQTRVGKLMSLACVAAHKTRHPRKVAA